MEWKKTNNISRRNLCRRNMTKCIRCFWKISWSKNNEHIHTKITERWDIKVSIDRRAFYHWQHHRVAFLDSINIFFNIQCKLTEKNHDCVIAHLFPLVIQFSMCEGIFKNSLEAWYTDKDSIERVGHLTRRVNTLQGIRLLGDVSQVLSLNKWLTWTWGIHKTTEST